MDRYHVKAFSVLLLAILLLGPDIVLSKISGLATVSGIAGNVQIQKAGGSDWIPAKEGALVSAGDKVKTGAKSSCVIKWNMGNIMKLTSFTSIVIEKMDKDPALDSENSSLNLWSGKVYAQAKKLKGRNSSFEVKTPTAIAGVRGTKMSVGVEANETTTVECLEGLVNVVGSAGGNVLLKDGQKTTVEKNSVPKPPAVMNDQDNKDFEDLDLVVELSLDITQPVGDIEADTSPIVVRGKTEAGANVSVNGKVVTADANGAFMASVDLVEGNNQVKIEASNSKGKVQTKNRQIKFRKKDKEKTVTLDVSKPPGDLETDSPTLVVQGQTDPGNSVTVNGSSVSVDFAGTFKGSVNLKDEFNQIKIEAKNRDGIVSTITRVVKYFPREEDREIILDIISPADGEEVSDMVDVRGLTNPGNTVIVNGASISVDASGSFFTQIGVYDSLDQITVEAKDKNGKSLKKARKITKQARNIELTVASPVERLITRDAMVNVSGAVNPSGSQITVNGLSAASQGGTFSASVALIEGENQITVEARLGSRARTVTRTVIRDTTAPMLMMIQPAGSTFQAGKDGCDPTGTSCTIIGMSEAGAQLSMNGVRCEVKIDGSFSCSVLLLQNDATINIAVSDSMGNRASKILTRVIDAAKVERIEVSVSPAAIVANMQNTATITVKTSNFLGEPADGQVTLFITSGGTLSASSITTAGGAGSVIFRSGVGSQLNIVTITATCGTVSSTATLTLTPDIPIAPE